MTIENKSFIHLRIWFEDGYYLEQTISSDYDIQWSYESTQQHGKITEIILYTEW